jgi:hypothetical protein
MLPRPLFHAATTHSHDRRAMQAPPSRQDGVAAKALSRNILAKIEKILAKIQAILAKISIQYFLAQLKGRCKGCLPKPRRPCSKKPRTPASFAYIQPHRQVWPCPPNPFSRTSGDKDGTRQALRQTWTTIKVRRDKPYGRSGQGQKRDKACLETEAISDNSRNDKALRKKQRAAKAKRRKP